jgi:ABC-type bacteriocin/lantibiotic exporter with double-glycine peptidase domain
VIVSWLLAAALAVPFVPQQKDTCGAASLAMVLRYWQVEISHDEIASALGDPELRGIRGSRLEAFARERGLTAIAYAGDLAQLREYVSKGRPLIVAWKLGRDRYHDVVVVGFAENGRVLVHDPAAGAGRAVEVRAFEERWAAAGHWTLLVLPKPR